jgi:HAMP domain-containing protein
MGVRLKFNLVLLAVFAVGLGATGYLSHELLHRNARDEVLRAAGVMMEASLSMRHYTVANVRPLLTYDNEKFLPESVPAFAATQVMAQLRKKYPDYSYKEAALNPTNPVNRAVDWETDILNVFRSDPAKGEISGMRDTPTGRSLYLARPMRIKDQACLSCHTTAAMAPPAMVKIYGPNNGYGWKLDEVIAAQIVSVPMNLAIKNANNAFVTFISSLALVFAVLFIVLNVMLTQLIVEPITRLSEIADQISKGRVNVAELPAQGRDEVAQLGQAFNRMRRSLEKAISLIDTKG